MSEEEKIPLLDGNENSYEDEKYRNLIIFKPISPSIYDKVVRAYENGNRTDKNEQVNYYLQLYIREPNNFKYYLRPYYFGISADINSDLGFSVFFPEISGDTEIGNVDFTDPQMYHITAGTYLMEVNIKFRFYIDNTCCDSSRTDLDTSVMLMVNVSYRPHGSFDEYPVDESSIVDLIKAFRGPMEDTNNTTSLRIDQRNVSEDNLYSIQFKKQIYNPLRCGVKLAINDSDRYDDTTPYKLIIQNESYIRFTRIIPKNLIRR